MTEQNREKALLEVIRRGLEIEDKISAETILGDRSAYVGMSDIAKYAECPRAAIMDKIENNTSGLSKLLTLRRGHWFENGVGNALFTQDLKYFHQLEIRLKRKTGIVMAHLDFTLVWNSPANAVRILEVKSTEKIPDSPWQAHCLQAQGQASILRKYWNKPVFNLPNAGGAGFWRDMTFPEICMKRLNIALPSKTENLSIESWILYLSMREAKAYGPFVYSPESHAEILRLGESMLADLKRCKSDDAHIERINYRQGFYPLCGNCEFNADCPKFKKGNLQPEWEDALVKLDILKNQKTEIANKITEIENALKQAHANSGSRDWIETGKHRFRMSMVTGRESLDQSSLKKEVASIFSKNNLTVDIDQLFSGCMKRGASFPRLTISTVN